MPDDEPTRAKSGVADVAVVMPAYNAAATIAEAIDGVLGQRTELTWEFVVADNGSSDDTARLAERLLADLPRARVIDAAARPGSNGARNAGVEATTAPLLLFTDSDDVADQSWMTSMVDTLRTFDLVGGSLDEETLNDPRFGGERLLGRPGLPVVLGYLPWVVGANMGVTRVAFEAVGGFDESWNAAGDDIDFSWRVQHAGFTIGHAPDAVVRYRHRDSLRSIFERAARYQRAECRLLSIYGSHGATWRGPVKAVRSWAKAVVVAARSLTAHSRLREAAWVAGALWGRVSGSIRYGVVNL